MMCTWVFLWLWLPFVGAAESISSSCNDANIKRGPPRRTGSIHLCVPHNLTTTVDIPLQALPRSGNRISFAASDTSSIWYMTLGDYWEWSWKNLVGETGPDWSSYTTNPWPKKWRSRLQLTKQSGTLKLTIRPFGELKTGCYQFTLAPYKSYTDGGAYWQVYICFTPRPTPQVFTTVVNQPQTSRVKITVRTDPPDVDDQVYLATGVSGVSNNWLLMAEQAANASKTSCVVCMGPRPILRVVPAPVPSDCLIGVMNSTHAPPNCRLWDTIYPAVKSGNDKPIFSNVVAPGNFSCVNVTQGARFLGSLNSSWCTTIIPVASAFRNTYRADLWWWCGGDHLFGQIPQNSIGLCGLASLLLPISVYPTTATELISTITVYTSSFYNHRKRSLSVDYDPTYIDAIGVPRGVPDEYKLVDQVAAGFESIICWWCTIGKNVDRINYIHFNVQRLGNITQRGFEAIHGQLAATSLMTFQNRIALDMLLADKGGVCVMFGTECCTFIPNNTASDGTLTLAIDGLRSLNKKMKEHSGVDTSMWDSWLDVFGKYKTLVSSILISLAVFAAILTLCGCCCIPCLRSLLNRLITTAISPAPKDDPQYSFPLLQVPEEHDSMINF